MDIWQGKRDIRDDDENENEKPKKKLFGGDSGESVTSINNHIYFYSSVNKKSILSLNKEIKRICEKMLEVSNKYEINPPSIYLHINSGGGSIFAAMAGIDHIRECPIPVITIIEGSAASAATLLSVVGDKRLITRHAHMLIHQLSTTFWGKMDEFEDEMENLNKLMNLIKNIYKKNTSVPIKKLNKILKHDLWWDPTECLKYGLVDEIIEPQKKYPFSE